MKPVFQALKFSVICQIIISNDQKYLFHNADMHFNIFLMKRKSALEKKTICLPEIQKNKCFFFFKNLTYIIHLKSLTTLLKNQFKLCSLKSEEWLGSTLTM